ncbi:MAG: PEGA domain-containing protein [Myxococcales bacterium]|nr:PEGA domain-containing protein [Myxococcales bacterium]
MRRALVLGWTLGLVSASTGAQPRMQAAADRGDAERAGKEGERLLAQHDAQRAVVELQRAYALSRNVKWLLPLGLAYAEADRPLDAIDALGRFLKEAPSVSEVRRREIGGRLQVLLDQVAAVVSIEATRDNAQVQVDGRAIGLTPLEAPVRLLPGSHEIVLVPAPTDPSSGARVVVDVRPGERRRVKLEPGPRSKFLEPQSQAAPVPTVPAGTGSDEGHGGLLRRWWLWAGVGAAVVLAIGLGVGLGTRQAGGPPAESVPAVPDWAGGPIDARGGALLTLAWGPGGR